MARARLLRVKRIKAARSKQIPVKNYSLRNGVVSVKIGNLAPKQSRFIVLRMRVSSSARGKRTNVASAIADNAPRARGKVTTRITPRNLGVLPAVTG